MALPTVVVAGNTPPEEGDPVFTFQRRKTLLLTANFAVVLWPVQADRYSPGGMMTLPCVEEATKLPVLVAEIAPVSNTRVPTVEVFEVIE